MPLLCSAYASLQDSSGYFFFALSGPSWEQTYTKFSLQTPAILAQFPAAAYIYRQGLLQVGATVVDAQLQISSLYQLNGKLKILEIHSFLYF